MTDKKNVVTTSDKPADTKTAEVKEEVKNLPSVKELKKMLDAQLVEISKKKKLADNRALFLNKLEHLNELKTSLSEDKKEGNFEQSKCKINFVVSGSNGYRDEEKLNISNTDLVIFFVDELSKKIEEVIARIETELVS